MSGYCAKCGETNCLCDAHIVTAADGQNVHCSRATFIATLGIPASARQRIRLGIEFGFGLAVGVMLAVCLVAVGSKIVRALFA